MKLRRSLPWIVLVIAVATLAGVMLAGMLSQKTVPLQSGSFLPQPRVLAPFRLSDLAGRQFGNAQLQGQPSLLFIGFTYCPDICQTTLATLRELQRQPPIPDLRVLFATIDPARDTPEVLRQYLAAFDANFIGLYAEPAAMAPLLRSLGAVAARENLPQGAYTMNHSATLYLLDTHGSLAAVFTPPYSAAVLRSDLQRVAQAAVL